MPNASMPLLEPRKQFRTEVSALLLELISFCYRKSEATLTQVRAHVWYFAVADKCLQVFQWAGKL